jgi:hypothetical protein
MLSDTPCCEHHSSYSKLSSACVDRRYHHPQTTTHLATPKALQRFNTQLRLCVKIHKCVFNGEITFTIVKMHSAEGFVITMFPDAVTVRTVVASACVCLGASLGYRPAHLAVT